MDYPQQFLVIVDDLTKILENPLTVNASNYYFDHVNQSVCSRYYFISNVCNQNDIFCYFVRTCKDSYGTWYFSAKSNKSDLIKSFSGYHESLDSGVPHQRVTLEELNVILDSERQSERVISPEPVPYHVSSCYATNVKPLAEHEVLKNLERDVAVISTKYCNAFEQPF